MATAMTSITTIEMTQEVEALVAAQVEAQVAARLGSYHNKAVVRGGAIVPVPLVVGEVFGACEAFLIQQIHFWCTSHGHLRDDQKWCRNTYSQWAEQLRMFSERTVERAVKHLVGLGVVVTGVFNKRIYDRTLWYRLDYERMCAMMSETLGGNWEVLCPEAAYLGIAQLDGDSAAKSVSSEPTDLALPIPEIPKEPENIKMYLLNKQSVKLTAKPQTGLVKAGAEEENIQDKQAVIEEAAPAHKMEFVKNPIEVVKVLPAPNWMNEGMPLPDRFHKAAERAVKAMKAEGVLKNTQMEKKVDKASGKPMTLANHWQACMATMYPGYQKPLTTKKDLGMLGKLGKDLGEQSQAVIEFALNHWCKFASKAKYSAGLATFPTAPQIGFLLVHHAVAVNLMQSIAKTPKPIAKPTTPVLTLEELKAKWKAEKEPPYQPSAEELAETFAYFANHKKS